MHARPNSSICDRKNLRPFACSTAEFTSVGPQECAKLGLRPSKRVRLKGALGLFGVYLRSTGVSVALQLGPSGASLSGRVKS